MVRRGRDDEVRQSIAAGPLPAVPLTPYILEHAVRLAGEAAFIDGTSGRTMTYGEFEDAVRRQAGGWLERGLAKGEVVAVMAPNCPEYAVVFHAIALAGGVRHHGQPDVHGGGGAPPTRRRGCDAPRDGADVPRDGRRPRSRTRPSRRCT